MSRLAFANIALLLAVSGAGLWTYVKPPREPIIAHILSTRPPAQAAKIRIERKGHSAIVLDRQHEQWRVALPVSAEADAHEVERVLAILTARAVERYPAVGLERYELAHPRLRLSIDDESFAFGMTNPVTGEQYVLTGEGVYPVAPRYGAALPLDAMQLARRRLLSAAEIPSRIATGEFAVARQDGKWTLAPGGAAISEDHLARWVESWRLTAAIRVAPAAGTRPALAEIKVALEGGASIAFAVVQREPELVIAREDEKFHYYFPAASAQRLLLPPARDQPLASK